MNGRPLSNNNKMVDIFWVKSNFPPLRNSKLKLAARERMRDHEISWNPSADLKMNDLNVQRELFSREMVVSKGSREAEKVAVVEGSDRCRHIALGVRGADVRRCRRPASRCWHKRWPTTITHARWRARIVQSRKMLGVRYTRKKKKAARLIFLSALVRQLRRRLNRRAVWIEIFPAFQTRPLSSPLSLWSNV